MHASSFITLAFFFSALSLATTATPTPITSNVDTPSVHLERRQINPLTTGLSAGGVHKARKNEDLVMELSAQLEDIHREVERLKAVEVTLAQTGVAPNLVRRQLGTILGAVGIHKSKQTRREVERMRGEVGALRHDVNVLLEAEHLQRSVGPLEHHEEGGEEVHHEAAEEAEAEEAGIEEAATEESGPEESLDESGPEESADIDESGDDHRLVRRQLGIILGPVAIHKARKDRRALESLRPEIDHLRMDCARIRTAQEQRLRTLNVLRRGGPMPVNRIIDTHVDVVVPAGGRVMHGGVLGSHDVRRGPTVTAHGGATYGAVHHRPAHRPAYGRPTHY